MDFETEDVDFAPSTSGAGFSGVEDAFAGDA
jgi:hypothetical protein